MPAKGKGKGKGPQKTTKETIAALRALPTKKEIAAQKAAQKVKDKKEVRMVCEKILLQFIPRVSWGLVNHAVVRKILNREITEEVLALTDTSLKVKKVIDGACEVYSHHNPTWSPIKAPIVNSVIAAVPPEIEADHVQIVEDERFSTARRVVWTGKTRWLVFHLYIHPDVLALIGHDKEILTYYIGTLSSVQKLRYASLAEAGVGCTPNLAAIKRGVSEFIDNMNAKCSARTGCNEPLHHARASMCTFHMIRRRIMAWDHRPELSAGEIDLRADVCARALVARYNRGGWTSCAWTGTIITHDNEWQLDHLHTRSGEEGAALFYDARNLSFVHGAENKARGNMSVPDYWDYKVRSTCAFMGFEEGGPEALKLERERIPQAVIAYNALMRGTA